MTPKVTIVIPHHLNENDEYLRNCLTSVLSTEDTELDVICISSAKHSPGLFKPVGPHNVRIFHDPSLNNATKKWHRGLELSHPQTDHAMLISDDVMVSKHTIGELARTAAVAPMIVGPASNCDATTRYVTTFRLRDFEIPLKCTLEEIRGLEQDVIDYPKTQKILIDPGWISFYCTLFPKDVIRRVGGFDESMDCRYNDVDYCGRARAMGIPSLLHLGCFALHFGDRTLPKCTTPEMYAAADAAYRKKYSQ